MNFNLNEVQTKLDKLGKTIRFVNEDEKTKTLPIKTLIQKMVNLEKTQTTMSKTPQRIGGSRSLQDMYLLCKHYHPNVNMPQVIEGLKELSVYTFYCGSFQRQMFAKSHLDRPDNTVIKHLDQYKWTPST